MLCFNAIDATLSGGALTYRTVLILFSNNEAWCIVHNALGLKNYVNT